jgi:hypothetical protein
MVQDMLEVEFYPSAVVETSPTGLVAALVALKGRSVTFLAFVATTFRRIKAGFLQVQGRPRRVSGSYSD